MIPGYIVNICRKISEKLSLETGLQSLTFEDGQLNLSQIAEEIKDNALEDLFEKKISEVERILALKKGMNAVISFEQTAKGVFKGKVNAPSKFRDVLSSCFASSMGLSKEDKSSLRFVNNALCFEYTLDLPEELIHEYVKNAISDSFSKIRSSLMEMKEEGLIASFVVSKDYRASFKFPPNERISDECAETLLSEISDLVESKGFETPSTFLRKKIIDEGRFIGVEVDDSLVGILISKNRTSVSIAGVVVEEDIVEEFGSVDVPANTIRNESVIDCDYIRSNLVSILGDFRL